MAFLSVISNDIIPVHFFDIEKLYINSRIYYSLGLIIAGIICDKQKELFNILTLAGFIFYLISTVLLNQNISPSMIISISFFFLGFFVVLRTIIFIRLSVDKKSMLFTVAYGLMYSRVAEGILTSLEKYILNHYLLTILIESIGLFILISIYVLLYMKNNLLTQSDKVKELSLKYELSIQEEKVLELLIQDLTNQEMADKLFLSINTVKNHLSSIYRKTEMSKKELREKCRLLTD